MYYGPECALGDDSRKQGIPKGSNRVQHIGSQFQQM
jgi:hypothetical protein